MNTKITSRAEARKAGLNNFSTGKLCRRGHDAVRRVSSGACIQCEAAWREANVPRTSRIIRVGNSKTKTRATEIHVEPEVEVLAKLMKYHLKQLLGRPVSNSVLYRAGVMLIAERINDTTDARAVFELVM